ncbi:MAG: adenosylcobinamide-phosphate synthase CbiB [Dissulfurispiraceae bacterium]
MKEPVILTLAFLLDLAMGDPQWLPHPVRIIGKGISRLESFLRGHFKTSAQEKWGGIALVVLIVIPTFLISFAMQEAILRGIDRGGIWMIMGSIGIVYLTSTTIAVRELISSVRVVVNSVKSQSVSSARDNLSMIVGRDTHDLSDEEILKAALESLAENLSDGIIAPLFYFTIGGLPLALSYKAINTLDSMVGYKNQRHLHFGWAAARLDDIANYLPARITGVLIVVATALVVRSPSAIYRSISIMLRDGKKHLSPNSGIPEAAMAGALDVRFGGPSTYGGSTVNKPYIGEDLQHTYQIYVVASDRAITIAQIVSLLGIAIAVGTLCGNAAL